jgi:hypothetical protein
MNQSPSVPSQSAEVRPVYDKVRILRAQWTELQSIPQAQAAYETALAAERDELAALQQRRDDLEDAQRRLEPSRYVPPVSPQPGPAGPRRPEWGPLREQVFVPAELPWGQSQPVVARIRLKKLINRWRFVWGLDPGVQAQINQIADSPDRPVGEALSLLPWSVFDNSAHPGESSEDHLQRLIQWGEALREYGDRLQEEIERLKLHYHRWLGIWEQWRECGWNTTEGATPAQRERWDAFLEAGRQDLHRKLGQVQREITRLHDVINDVGADTRGLGGLR